MKTKQTKIDRSAAKWLPGAMALAATTASSQAATVQITLTGNKISSTGGNQLNADLTGDSQLDVGLSDAHYGSTSVGVEVDGVNVFAMHTNRGGIERYWNLFHPTPTSGIGGVPSSEEQDAPWSAAYLSPFTFSDSRINGGVATAGWLEVKAFNRATDQTVELSRLIFDDASTTRPTFTEIPGAQTEWGAVPEPSSLGLLALGAGGLLLRRGRAKAAA